MKERAKEYPKHSKSREHDNRRRINIIGERKRKIIGEREREKEWVREGV
jgi:hypothetical protein